MSETKRVRRRRRRAAAAWRLRAQRRGATALLAGALALAGCDGATEEPIQPKIPVVAQVVELGDIEELLIATGTLRAAEVAVLSTESPGTLRIARRADGRRLAEGDSVRAGQLIAEITGEDARLAARTESTFQRYESARQVLEARRRLFDEGLISEEELRNAETSLVNAKTEWEQSRLTETRSRSVAPIGGVILRLARGGEGLPMADGQLVGPGMEVARIAPLDPLIADVDLIGSDVARVSEGMPARVRQLAWEREEFSGEVIRLAPEIDPRTRTVRAEVRVDNRDRLLRPGMFVEVTFVTERRVGVPVVPREAVVERGGQKVVFVVDGQRAARREVGVGLGDDERLEIASGVEAGERVIVRGLETLADGVEIRVTGR